MTFAVAAKVIGLVITASLGPTPIAANAKCRAAVHELTATASPEPIYSANFAANALVRGPVVIQSESRVCRISLFSSSPNHGAENGRKACLCASAAKGETISVAIFSPVSRDENLQRADRDRSSRERRSISGAFREALQHAQRGLLRGRALRELADHRLVIELRSCRQ